MDDLANTRELLKRQLNDAVADHPLDALTTIGAVQRDIATHERDAVRAAVQHHSWAEIGEALGVSKQAAHQRFAKEWAETLKNEVKAEHKAFKTARRDGAHELAAAASAKRDALVAELRNAGRRRK
jgi:hypothetical protein